MEIRWRNTYVCCCGEWQSEQHRKDALDTCPECENPCDPIKSFNIEHEFAQGDAE